MECQGNEVVCCVSCFLHHIHTLPSHTLSPPTHTALLVLDPAKRLGSAQGAEDIKAHPFFRKVNWALLRHETAPYIPKAGGGVKAVGGVSMESSSGIKSTDMSP